MKLLQFSIFIQNSPGAFYKLAKVFSDNHINMRALSATETDDYGIVRTIVDNHEKAEAILKEAGYVFKIVEVLGIEVPNQPGGLISIVEILKNENINLEYMYAFAGNTHDNAYFVMRVDDPEKTIGILTARGIDLLKE